MSSQTRGRPRSALAWAEDAHALVQVRPRQAQALAERALGDAARALRLLRRDGDVIWEARLLFNRGLLHLDRGGLDRADADLNAARVLFTQAGADAAVVDTLTVLGGIALLRGDVLGCLKTLEDAQASVPAGTIAYNLADWRVLALAQAR